MKITKAKLKQIILEEVSSMETAGRPPEYEGRPETADGHEKLRSYLADRLDGDLAVLVMAAVDRCGDTSSISALSNSTIITEALNEDAFEAAGAKEDIQDAIEMLQSEQELQDRYPDDYQSGIVFHVINRLDEALRKMDTLSDPTNRYNENTVR